MLSDLLSDLVNLTDAELDAFVREQELRRRATEATLAAAIAVAEARLIPAIDGHRSTRSYLKATCNWADGEAGRFRSAAHTVNAHPAIGEAWLAGNIGSSQVAAIARVRTRRNCSERFAEFVPLFVEQAEQLPLADFHRVLDRFVNLADADGTHDEREAVERRSATVNEVGGELALSASGGDATSTAEFIEIMRRYEQREFDRDLARHEAAIAKGDEPPTMRTGPQRRFDALLAIARSAAAHDGVASPSEPLVSVLVDQHTMSMVLARSGLGATDSLTGEHVDPFTGLPTSALGSTLDHLTADVLGSPDDFLARRCETTTGVPLRLTDVLRSLLSGRLRRVVLGANSCVIDLGRSSRVFTGSARDAAKLLTVTCDHPGCDMPVAWCQVDHSVEWHEQGETNQANSGNPCGPHNVAKHQRKFRTKRARNGRMYTFRSDGTIMLPVGCRIPAFADDDADHDAADENDRSPDSGTGSAAA